MLKRRSTIFLLLALVVFAVSCAPKKGNGDQKDPKSEILASLNRGDNQGALEQIERALAENPNDLELQYFKAQALSSMTGIDVYSLFPVLKIKLFEVAMTEWQSYQKYKYLTENSTLNGMRPENHEEVIAAIDLMQEKLKTIKLEEIPYEVVKDPLNEPWHKNTCLVYVKIISKFLVDMDKNRVFLDGDALISNTEYLPLGGTCTDAQRNDPVPATGVRYRILHEAKDKLHDRRRNLIDQKKAAAYVQALYVLFDAVPILRQIPEYQHSNLPRTMEALKILQNVRKERDKTDRLGKNSRQQITLITAYLLASALKKSLDLSSIIRPNDLICRMSPEVAADQYEVVTKAGKHLFVVIQDTEFFEAHREQLQKQNLIETAREALYDLPEHSDDATRKKIIEFIRNLQRERC